MIRVLLPHHLSTLAQTGREIELDVGDRPTLELVVDALEAAYPVLRGTVRDPVSGRRRPFIRFFACEQDLSNASLEIALPEAVANGNEPLYVVGAMAGG